MNDGGRDVGGSADRASVDLRFKLDFLQSDELAGELVPGLVDDAVGALADLLDLLEVLHGDITLLTIHAPAVEVVNTASKGRSPFKPKPAGVMHCYSSFGRIQGWLAIKENAGKVVRRNSLNPAVCRLRYRRWLCRQIESH